MMHIDPANGCATHREEAAGPDAAASLTGTGGRPLQDEQVELIYTQAPVALATALVIAILMTAGLWALADTALLLLWLGAQFVQSLLRGVLVFCYRLAALQIRVSNPIWMRLYLAGTLLSGVIWGCLGLFIDFAWPIEYTVLILMGLAGVTAGAISSYAASMQVYIAFLVPALMVPAESMVAQAGYTANVMGLLLMAFCAALLVIANNYNRSITRSLRLRYENSELVQQMSRANTYLEKEIRERQQVEDELVRERQLFTNGPVIVLRWRASSGWPIEYASGTVAQFGYVAEDLVSRQVCYSELVFKNDLQRVEQAKIINPARGYSTTGIDYRVVRADGEPRWVYDYTIPVRDKSGDITHYAGYLLDITERKQAVYGLQQEKDRVEITLRSIGDAVITTDVNGQVEYLNPAAEQLTGWESDIARGLPLNRIFSRFDEEGRLCIEQPVMHSLQAGRSFRSGRDYILSRNDGTRLSIQFSTSPISGFGGESLGVVMVFHDVTENRTMARQISYQASHDLLTGLINRPEFEKRLRYALDSARKENEYHVLCYLDLDQFKLVNDTCCHSAGDNMLKVVAHKLQGCLREADVLGRLGGDEFGILLKNCTLDHASEVAGKMLSLIQATEFESCGRSFEITASVGISVIDADSQSITEVMKAADLACFAAKDLGRNRAHIYQSSDRELARRHDEMKWVSRLKDALDEGQLVLYSQDIVPVAPGANDARHIEVLIRMLDENANLVMPGKFLPAAETYSMIGEIDRWVVEHAFRWYSQGRESLTMSINLSGKSISDPGMLDFIKCKLVEYDVPAGDVCFEVTETAAVANLELAAGFMHELRDLGCSFALDDFGSGLSSFAYLRGLPVNYLKIDGCFVRNIDTDPVNRAMVNAIKQLGDVMQISTIAEFVEHDGIRKQLAEIGVDYAQGYGIALPRPLLGSSDQVHRSA
jgi:diguanylate cyclase (GGDEF)-like protein/PAS domain S-box-containing protein